MRRVSLLFLLLIFLSGCQTVNDTFVRRMFGDPGLSRRVRHQIKEGLERREEKPPAPRPRQPAPPFMDEGLREKGTVLPADGVEVTLLF